jgi:hypothetical protein
MSVDNYFTRQYIQEDSSELHTRRRENLKSHPAGMLDVCSEVLTERYIHGSFQSSHANSSR